MLDQMTQDLLLHFISFIIAVVLFVLVHDDLNLKSDAEKAAVLICLIASSVVFYQIFLLFAILAGVSIMSMYLATKIKSYISRSSETTHANLNRNSPAIQRTSKREIDVSEISLEMDLTEEE
jgi:predicted membrane protein